MSTPGRLDTKRGQGDDTRVGDQMTLDQANPLELGKIGGKLRYAPICQKRTRRQVDISDPSASSRQGDDGVVRQTDTVPEMNVMQDFAEFCDGVDCVVGEIPTLCQYKIPQTRAGCDYSIDGTIVNFETIGKIEHAQRVEAACRRSKRRECTMVD